MNPETANPGEPARPQGGPRAVIWWLLVAVLGMAVIIDAVDGQPLKLLNSVVLFAASLVGALTRSPKSTAVKSLIVGLALVGLGLLVFRAAGPGF